jgi:hypothetical protein
MAPRVRRNAQKSAPTAGGAEAENPLYMSARGASPPSASDSTGADDPRFARLSVELAKIAAAQAAQAAVLASVSAALQELLAAREETRKELLASREETRELREELLVPLRVAAREERNREQRAHNFISALIVTAKKKKNGFERDVAPFLALCRETRGEEVLWDAVKDISSPLCKRTRLMYAAKVGVVGRLRWLLTLTLTPLGQIAQLCDTFAATGAMGLTTRVFTPYDGLSL